MVANCDCNVLESNMTKPTEKYDVVIVGMGVFGSATAYQLSLQQNTPKVLCLEQYNITPRIHANGSSHGNSRIIRFSYEDEIYSRMGIESLEQWQNIEKASNTKLYTQTGGLDFGSENHHMMQTVINVAKKNKLEHEILNARQIKERFPAFNKPTFQNDYVGLYQRDAGILNASECVNTLQVLALRNKNITIREHQKVIQIVSNLSEYKHLITIQPTDRNSYQVYAKKIVLCLGSWTSKFLKESVPNKVSLNLNIIQTSYGFWHVPEQAQEAYQIGKLPLWIHWGRYFDFLHPEDTVHVQQFSNEQDLAYFGFPIFEQKGAFKAGIHYSLQNDDRLEDPTLERNFSMPDRKIKIMKQYLAQNYVGMDFNKREFNTPFTFETCLYTTSKHDDFIIDVHPRDNSIVVCGACNGHAFKFALLIGRMAMELLQNPKRDAFSLNVRQKQENIPRSKFSMAVSIQDNHLTSKL